MATRRESPPLIRPLTGSIKQVYKSNTRRQIVECPETANAPMLVNAHPT